MPRSEGGADSSDNAIALCFDCHAASGHYNPKHPRGTKFSPGELRKHRDSWHALVATGKVPKLEHEDEPGYHVRHLLSLDNDATLELLNLERANLPFRASFIQNNEVLRFMRRVLADDLPFTWQTSERAVGHFWAGEYATLQDFHAANPDFNGDMKRRLLESDFGPNGIRSEVLRECYDSGMRLSDIGVAEVSDAGCGGVTMFFSLRRPLYVFCDLTNVSGAPITVTALRAVRQLGPGINPRQFPSAGEAAVAIPITPIVLQPNESLVIPTSVLLGPFDSDDLQTDYSTYESISKEQGQSFGLRMDTSPAVENDRLGHSSYFRVGPSIDIRQIQVISGSKDALMDVHDFDPNQCYLWHRAWHVGSCPHIFFRNECGEWNYFGEVLTDSWRIETTDHLVAPQDAQLLRIAEVEFETSILYSVKIDDVERLDRPLQLNRGDHLDFALTPGARIHLQGLYDCTIPRPQCSLHLRQKRSLVACYTSVLCAK